MALLAAMVVAVACVVFLDGLWSDLLPKQAAALRKWLRNWTIKGLGVPFLVWLVFNCGLSSRFPPLMPQIDMAKAGAPRMHAFVNIAAIGLFVITTYWAAISAGWLASVLWEGSDNRAELKQIALGASVLLVPLGLLICWMGGWGFAGLAVAIWLFPVVRGGFDLLRVSKKPLYSKAIAKMHFDKYREAESAVIEELEKDEEDFEGWMMLAELYANHFGDLEGAERVVRDSCNHPETTPSQFASAFHRLADWHLKFASDPVGARRDLEEICKRYPKSHLDRMAQLRIDQLPASREELMEQREVKPVHLPAITFAREPEEPLPTGAFTPKDAVARANQCVAKLKQNPDNIVAREELARVFTEQLGKADLGIEQLELLLTIKGIAESKTAQWLALLGAWQIKYKDDRAAGKQTLERLIANYPKSPQAFAAQRRLNLMDVEERQRAARAGAGDTARQIKIRI